MISPNVLRRRSTRRCLVSLTLVAVVAACGSDDDGDTSATTAVVPQDTAGETTIAAASESTSDAASATETSAAGPAEAGGDTQGDLDALYEAAKQEGQLLVYSSVNEIPVRVAAEAFEAKYPGIDVEAIRIGDNEQIPRLETELSTGAATADLINNASPAWMEEKAATGAWAAPTLSPTLLGEGEYDVEEYAREGNVFEIGAGVLTFAWNTDLVPDGLTDYPDLLDESLGDGKLGVIELASAPANDFYLFLEQEFGEDIFAGLGAQRPRIYPSTLGIIEALQSGEIYATNWCAPQLLEAAKANGAPVDYAVSPAGAYGAKHFAVINAEAANPNAAELYLDFLLSPEGQAIYWEYQSSVIPDVEGALITNDQIPDADPAQSTPEKVEEGRARFDAAYR